VIGEDIEAIVKKAVHESVKAELGSYKVDKEQHYQDHIFMKDFREWYDGIKSSFWKSIVGAFMMMLFALLFFGFIFWGKVSFK
jgi:hypothetical protein